MSEFIYNMLQFIAVFAAYFLPTIIAQRRKHRNHNAILVTNLFFGWTGIGWIICLIWCSSDNVAVKD